MLRMDMVLFTESVSKRLIVVIGV
jgi:serine/threonine protein kinase